MDPYDQNRAPTWQRVGVWLFISLGSCAIWFVVGWLILR